MPTIPIGGSCKNALQWEEVQALGSADLLREGWEFGELPGLRVEGRRGKWPITRDDNGNSAAADKKRSFE